MDQLAFDEKRVNHKDLFNTFSALTGNIRISVYPQADFDINTANPFVHSVKDTISNISKAFDRKGIPSKNESSCVAEDRVFDRFHQPTLHGIVTYKYSKYTNLPVSHVLVIHSRQIFFKKLFERDLNSNCATYNCLNIVTDLQLFKEALVIPI